MSRELKKILLFMMIFIILLSNGNVVFANQLEGDNSLLIEEKINFNNLTTKDGLSSNLITDIYQDSLGYIWIGTEDGLNKYNGNMVVKYNYEINNKNSLTSPYITAINEDKYGDMWIGTDCGLNIINRQESNIIRICTKEENNSGLSNYEITSIYRDSNDTMWVGTKNGLNRYDEKNNKFIKYYSDGSSTSLDNNHITYIKEDDIGNLWIGTKDGANIIDLKTNYISNNKSKYSKLEYIYEIEKDTKGNIWISSESGIVVLNENNELNDYNDELRNYNIDIETKVLCDSNNNIWFYGDNGLMRYIQDSNETNIYNTSNSHLISNSIRCLYEDRSGVIWVGSNKGISILNIKQQFSNKINNIFKKYGISESSITSFLQDIDGDLWVGTEENGLVYFDRNEKSMLRFVHDENEEISLLSNKIKYILEASNGNIIICTEKGVDVINKKMREHYIYAYDEYNRNLFLSKEFKTINDGNYTWAATIEGLYRDTNGTHEVTYYRDDFINAGINNYEIYDIFQDKSDENILWLAGGIDAGLIKFHKTKGIIKNYLANSEDNSLSYDYINCIQGDEEGNIWIGTKVGLNKFNIEEETFTKYYEKDGLGSHYINSIIIDDNEDIWLGTSNGLSKFIIDENRFINFKEVDGVCGNQFNKRAAYKTKEGQLLFGTTNGVVSFDPNTIGEITPIVDKVVLDTLWINRNLYITDGETLELNYNENTITFAYFLPNYTRIGNITYLYKMDAINEEWNVSNKEGYAVYTKLKPGKYTFRVKAVKSDGSLTEESTINFIIKKPFWQSNIAYCLYLALFMLVIFWGGYRLKFLKKIVANQTKEINRQMEENKKLYEQNIRNEQFKNDYFVNLSHELRTPINIILSVIQLLNSLEKSGKDTDKKTSHYMGVIKKSSNNLLNIINDIIDSSKIESGAYKINKEENVDIVYLVEETALNMSDYIKEKGIELIIDPEVEEMVISCDPKEIERCIINLIGNSVKFTEQGGKIEVLIKRDEETVSISIVDNGLGISKDDQEFIFKRFEQGKNFNSTKVSSSGIGLTLVKYIVELHDGHITLESELNKGSSFTIILPVN